MSRNSQHKYWSSLIVQIRDALKLNQQEFSNLLKTTQATVSRWENGDTLPSLRNQQLIEELAGAANLASINGLLKIVDASPFPMILTDRDSNVVAASKSSGFKAGLTVIDQTPQEERETFLKFADAVIASGFWDEDGKRFDYVFTIDGKKRAAVVQSVRIRGNVYALVQRLGE